MYDRQERICCRDCRVWFRGTLYFQALFAIGTAGSICTFRVSAGIIESIRGPSTRYFIACLDVSKRHFGFPLGFESDEETDRLRGLM